MKIGLQGKFVFFFLMFGTAMLAAVWILVYLFAGEVFLDHYADSIGKIVNVTAYGLDLTSKEMRRYGETGVADAHYRKILKQLNEIRELSDLQYLYIIYPKGEKEAVWLFDASGEDAEKLGTPVSDYTSEAFAAVREVYAAGEKNGKLDRTDTDLGKLVSVYCPLGDEKGPTVAVLGADKSLNDIMDAMTEKLMQISVRMGVLIAAGMLVLLLFVQFGIIRSVRRLKQGVQRMSDGELGIQISCRRRDEIGDITAVFNRMSANIKGHIKEVEELNGAYQKFVPPETFEILHKSNIVEIRLGDQAREELTVLSMAPENFKETTQNMTPAETFRYINGILETAVPAVLKEGGTIEHFEKAGLCSLYRNSAAYALKSAVLACENMRKSKGKLTAGIAFGTVMVGIAGHSDRMGLINISEETKISAFLMEIAPKYHASILLSKGAAEQIEGLRKSYHCRFLGYIKITVSGRLEGVVDVFDGDSTEDRRQKQMTKEIFEQGVTYFTERKYEDARESFIEVLKRYRRDSAAREYLSLCNKYLKEGGEGSAYIEDLQSAE